MDLGIRLEIARTNADDSVSPQHRPVCPDGIRSGGEVRNEEIVRVAGSEWFPGSRLSTDFPQESHPVFLAKLETYSELLRPALRINPAKQRLRKRNHDQGPIHASLRSGRRNGAGRWPSKFEVNFALPLGYK